MLKALRALVASASGSTAIEYALIAALISTVIIGGATVVGSNVGTMFNTVSDEVAEVVK